VPRPDAPTAVLHAAARLFDARGYATVSIGDLTAASGVSNGSIYHHFSSKDGVLAALVVGALADYQRLLVAVLDAHRDDAQGGIRAAVAHELRWLERHPREARLIIAHRDAVAQSATGREPLRTANRAFTRAVRAWLDRHDATRGLDVNLLHAVVFAPARELGALWLAKRSKAKPTTYSATLGDAAWAALAALPTPTPATKAITST
jgi:AcrR family transcriptional regulator